MQNGKMPLVALCLPSGGTWKAKMGMDLLYLVTYTLSQSVQVMPICNEGSSISNGRNHLVLNALAIKADYLFFVDTDITHPPDGLLRLKAHDKDVVCATYNRRIPPYDTLGVWEGEWKPDKDGKVGIVKATKIPTGFLLLKAGVFKKMKGPPWFMEVYTQATISDRNQTGHISDDYVFSHRLIEEGFQPYIDLDLTFEIGHIGERVIVAERPKLQQAAQ